MIRKKETKMTLQDMKMRKEIIKAMYLGTINSPEKLAKIINVSFSSDEMKAKNWKLLSPFVETIDYHFEDGELIEVKRTFQDKLKDLDDEINDIQKVIEINEGRRSRNLENMEKETDDKIKDMYSNLASRDMEIIKNRKPKLSGLKRKQEIFKNVIDKI